MLKLQRAENILLFLVILFLPTQLGKHFWPHFSYIYSLPIDYLSPTVYFWDLLVVLLITVSFLRGKYFKKLPLNIFLFFTLTQVISLLPYSSIQSLGVGLVRLEQYLVAGLFGVYVASFNIKSKIIWPLVLAVILESSLAVTQFLKGSTIGLWLLGERSFSITIPGISKFDFYGTEVLRPYATFPHPNVLASFLVISLLLLFALRKDKLNYLFYISAFFAFLTTFLTFSRTAILAMVTLLFLLGKKMRIGLIVLLILLSPFLYTRFWGVFNFDSLSLTRREELSDIAIKLWQSSPIFGVGLNSFIPQGSDQLLSGPNRFLQPVHNIFLLTLSETGLIGLFGLLILIGYPIFKFFKLFPKPLTPNPMLLIWSVIIFLGLFDHYFLTLPQGYRVMFLVWGISLSMLK